MNNKSDLFGTFYPICEKCNSPITSIYDSEFTNIKLFGPPYMECDKCGNLNKTFHKPYSKISRISKLKFWFSVISFPLLIWFIAAPSFAISIGTKFIFGEPSYVLLLIFIPISTITGLIFIILKNLKLIDKLEKEHLKVGDKYWES
jgi:hypothetical protein